MYITINFIVLSWLSFRQWGTCAGARQRGGTRRKAKGEGKRLLLCVFRKSSCNFVFCFNIIFTFISRDERTVGVASQQLGWRWKDDKDGRRDELDSREEDNNVLIFKSGQLYYFLSSVEFETHDQKRADSALLPAHAFTFSSFISLKCEIHCTMALKWSDVKVSTKLGKHFLLVLANFMNCIVSHLKINKSLSLPETKTERASEKWRKGGFWKPYDIFHFISFLLISYFIWASIICIYIFALSLVMKRHPNCISLIISFFLHRSQNIPFSVFRFCAI